MAHWVDFQATSSGSVMSRWPQYRGTGRWCPGFGLRYSGPMDMFLITDYRGLEVSAFGRCLLAVSMMRLDHMGCFQPSCPCLHLESGDVSFDEVKPWAFGFHLSVKNPMFPSSYLYIQGPDVGAFLIAGEVDLREKQRAGFAVAVRTKRCGTRGLLLVSGCLGRPEVEHEASVPFAYVVFCTVCSPRSRLVLVPRH